MEIIEPILVDSVRYYTVEQAAEIIGVTRGRVTQWVCGGRFPGSRKISHVLLLPASEVHGFRRNPAGRPRKPQVVAE